MREFFGFSLIELMVVVAVFSVVAALLIPRYLKHRLEAKQAECHQNLKSLFAAEKKYFGETNNFTTDLNELHLKPKGKPWHQYQFRPNPPPKNGYLFECSGNLDKDPTLDEATIDETGQITQVSDDVRR